MPTVFDHPAARWAYEQALNGNLFYAAVALLTLAAAVRLAGTWVPMRRFRHIGAALLVIGGAGLSVAAGSLTLWWLAYLGALALTASLRRPYRKLRAAGCILAAVLLIVATVDAWRYETAAYPAIEAPAKMYVFGGRTALNERGRPAGAWPRFLEQLRGRPVINMAVPDATLADALKILDEHPIRESTVLIALGRRDMHNLSLARYRARLHRLLARLRAADNTLILLEMPAPLTSPWHAWVQRRAAEKYNARLIPKRTVTAAWFAERPHRALAHRVHQRLRQWQGAASQR